MLSSTTKRRIVWMYGNGNDCTIFDLAKKLGVGADEVLSAICEYRRAKRFHEEHKKCDGCRWKPCVAAPVCYREVIDRE